MSVNNLTTAQLENIQIDYGIVYVNYGETDAKKLGPTRGGGVFTATANIRNIEYDGNMGKTKGMQVVDEINAMLKVGVLDVSQETLALAMPGSESVTSGNPAVTVIQNTVGGVIPASKYLKNITMFARVVKGGYKKITLFNAMAEGDFTLSAVPKAEGVVTLEIHAHWDATDIGAGKLYKIEDVATIA